MKWNITITPEYKIKFSSEYARETFDKYYTGIKDVFDLVEKKRKSREQLGFYFAGLIYSFCDWHEAFDWKNKQDRDDAHESFLKEYNFGICKGLDGKPKKYAKRLHDATKQQCTEYENRVVEGFAEQGIPIPDTKLYDDWKCKYKDDGYPVFFEWLEELGIRSDGTPRVNK